MVLFIIVVRIAAAVIEALLPTLKDMRSYLNSIRHTVDLLHETVKTLAGEFEEHRDDTQSQFAEIKTDLQTSQS